MSDTIWHEGIQYTVVYRLYGGVKMKKEPKPCKGKAKADHCQHNPCCFCEAVQPLREHPVKTNRKVHGTYCPPRKVKA